MNVSLRLQGLDKLLIAYNHLNINRVYTPDKERKNTKDSINYAGRERRVHGSNTTETFIGDKCVERSYFTIVFP